MDSNWAGVKMKLSLQNNFVYLDPSRIFNCYHIYLILSGKIVRLPKHTRSRFWSELIGSLALDLHLNAYFLQEIYSLLFFLKKEEEVMSSPTDHKWWPNYLGGIPVECHRSIAGSMPLGKNNALGCSAMCYP